MRSQTTAPKPEDTTVEASRSKKPLTKNRRYDETDLHAINVAHAMSELQDGSTTVLTLADGSLLKTADDISKKVVGLNDEDNFALENVNLAEQQHQKEGIRQSERWNSALAELVVMLDSTMTNLKIWAAVKHRLGLREVVVVLDPMASDEAFRSVRTFKTTKTATNPTCLPLKKERQSLWSPPRQMWLHRAL
jgi:hypothetical protein